MASQRRRGEKIELRAYAGTDPATGKREYLYDRVPADMGKREFDRRVKQLDGSALKKLEKRRERRRDPDAPKRPARPRPTKARTVRDAVEAWWLHHGSKLAAAAGRRPLIDGIILPHLGDLKLTLLAPTGTPPDDPDDRDDDLVYIAEKWEEIRLTARRVGDGPLAASTIQTCHTSILAPALRRAGHPIADPGLPKADDAAETTPLPDEMTGFLPHLAAARATAAYKVTRRTRGGTTSYEVPARPAEPTAMDLMLEAFALLVANGPRPVEAAALTRTQIDLTTGSCSFDGRGVVRRTGPDGEVWEIVGGESAKRRRRVITLDGRTLAAVRRWLAFQDEYALTAGTRLGGRALVFSFDPDGAEPISPKVFSKAFDRAVDRAVAAGADLPDGFHLYDMRHFGITQLLRAGRPVAIVARRFGTSARMIHERYEHAIPGDDAALADTLGAVWGENRPAAVVVPLRDSDGVSVDGAVSDGSTASSPLGG